MFESVCHFDRSDNGVEKSRLNGDLSAAVEMTNLKIAALRLPAGRQARNDKKTASWQFRAF
ncbi:MAG: hypothetical protein ABII13_05825 [Patescibacteria group bacterium]|nr:hypothetical protein [Patescibacteria group bacterium]MBU2509552.1 hypothetical protein [Patescibacteria group bacterium]